MCVLYRVFLCPVFVDVNLLARHVLGALFMGFYKEKCYFCLVLQSDGQRQCLEGGWGGGVASETAVE